METRILEWKLLPLTLSVLLIFSTSIPFNPIHLNTDDRGLRSSSTARALTRFQCLIIIYIYIYIQNHSEPLRKNNPESPYYRYNFTTQITKVTAH